MGDLDLKSEWVGFKQGLRWVNQG